ncbi:MULTISPECIES: LysR family transcriptional regulator [Rhizobium]|uniref:LysR family transcriptional regulator n=1 Tax=Rhizobium phaseoli TaxID=396 RepID=A0A7X6J3X2_9HYPH|nr:MULTISPECIES: LysR family transcriptional regulator [Rhizobium]ANL38272.1 LysR family transcriptional regulator protein [Rhizobium phaseoli]ANM01976.1 LysR family transcriptional regulator protein [Rhizobium phaseoli]MDE8763042.1 LysR family transcriptional regulator [Rhizobium sp. CBK13]NKF13337.1 LysR family transcriptional regulator [Rhizobium phaseoli]QPK12534.1 LysR family transcriptional regulator [Rhizobium phaseoli]
MRDVSLERLRAFVAVAEQGGLSAAGRFLGKAQSAVSESIAATEGQLGYLLFRKTGRRTELTDHGVALLPEAKATLEAADAFKAKAASFQGNVEAELSFAVDVMVPTSRLTAVINRFQREFPHTALAVYSESLGSTLQTVWDNQASFAVIGTLPDAPAEFYTAPLCEVPMCLVVGSAHPLAQASEPISKETLCQHNQLIISDKTSRSSGRSFGVFSEKFWRVADLGSKLEFLRAGLGWGLMPEHLVEDDFRTGRLLPKRSEVENLPDGWMPIPLSIAYKRARPPGPAGKWMIENLRFECKT